jgi:hypothetical protein
LKETNADGGKGMISFEKLLLAYAAETRATYATPRTINYCEQTATGFKVEFVPEDQTYSPETVDIPLEALLGWMWGKILEVKG